MKNKISLDTKKWKEFRFSLLQEGIYEDYEIVDNTDDESVVELRKEFIEKIFPLIDKWSDDVAAVAKSGVSKYYYRLNKFIGELYKLLRAEKLDEMPKYEIPESMLQESNKVDLYYNKIVADLRTISRNLSDDEVFDLHEKLKGFFNKLI